MPWRTAPACPVSPPPCTRTRRSYWPSRPAVFSGETAIVCQTARGKYSSIVRPLTQVVPSPGRRMTRATEVLRLPVPRYWAIWLNSLLQVQRLRVLRAVRMLGPSVDLQLGQLLPREPGPGEHPLDGGADDLGRAPVELLAQRPALEAARIAGVAGITPPGQVIFRGRGTLLSP